jgi:hypothetical protein
MENAKTQYNRIMNDLGLEFLTIGTRFSENTERWNLRDMVCECQYQLEVCYEDGNANSDGRIIRDYMDMYGCSKEEATNAHSIWLSKTKKLRTFINKYKREALKLNGVMNHSSTIG